MTDHAQQALPSIPLVPLDDGSRPVATSRAVTTSVTTLIARQEAMPHP